MPSRRHDDLERIPVLLDQAQLREARFELFDRALGRAATPASPRLRFLQFRLGDEDFVRAARAAAARRRSAARSRESTVTVGGDGEPSGSSGPSSGHQSVISEQPTLQSDPS